ncbi:GntR family transcriptional regulator [Corynebacterium sp. LK2590]|uniref:GntR family transcriptional regulator n=1 Tax=unclassified Corynebacterium TaxID=2624378 RepID=UPI0034CFA531
MAITAKDPRPIYQQIAEELRGMILSGQLPEGDRTPSTHELANFHEVTPTTASKALTALAQAGLVESQRGRGMFVMPGARERIRDQRKKAFAQDFVRPLVAEANALGLGEDDIAQMIAKELRP